MYMWHFRPEAADWAMVGPFFESKVLSGDIPLYYANGTTYGVPWCADNVEKVSFRLLSHCIMNRNSFRTQHSCSIRELSIHKHKHKYI